MDILKSRSHGNLHILSVSVHIASFHFQQHEFVEHINSIVLQYNCSPHLLELELTERTIMKDSDDIVVKLIKLKGIDKTLLLKEMGCDIIRGYYYNKPLDINELLDFIELWEIYRQERNI